MMKKIGHIHSMKGEDSVEQCSIHIACTCADVQLPYWPWQFCVYFATNRQEGQVSAILADKAMPVSLLEKIASVKQQERMRPGFRDDSCESGLCFPYQYFFPSVRGGQQRPDIKVLRVKDLYLCLFFPRFVRDIFKFLEEI